MSFTFLKEFFVRFLRSRGWSHHFQRLVFFDTTDLGSKELQHATNAALHEASAASPHILLQKLGTTPVGLTLEQAESRIEQVGRNEVLQEKPLPWWQHLWHCYKTPFDLLLTLLAVVSYVTNDIQATVVISAMVVVSVSIRFFQERKSNKAANALKALVSNTATVLRPWEAEAEAGTDSTAHAAEQPWRGNTPSRKTETPIQHLVPGDMVALAAGDMVPADCRLLAAKDLFVSQSAMTGESLPVEKFPVHKGADSASALDLENLVFMGTNVVSGSTTAVVVHTGSQTYFGSLAQRITTTERAPTQFQEGVNKVAWLLIRFMFVMVPLVLFINGLTKHSWTEAFLFAMSIAVGLTPEMLPMIVTSTLAKGAVKLSRQKVIVKRLDAIQNFGAMDILCTDKTGTLTQDKIFLVRHVNVQGEESDDVLEMAYLNSYYQTGLKNLLDVAVLEHAEVNRSLNPAANYRKVDEIPFDFQRRRMSVVVSERGDHHELICKGAVEEILAICTHVRMDGRDVPLSAELLAHIQGITGALNADGLRVVAVAAKETPPAQEVYGVADESGLTLMGYVAFLDPPKESTAPTLQALRQHGIKVKVLTGDNELVTAKICREVGLSDEAALLGTHIERMDDAQLAQAVEAHAVFAKLTPAHKERIVRTLKANGHVVGFMGDGINDAPALRAADIGISVDSAVDIAKESADIILLEKSLMVLEEGVMEGRKTFANMLKYIKMTASSNFGNVLSVLVASAFIPFLPMLPMHLLVQNLLYDFSQTAIPFDNVDDELVQAPQRWNPADISRVMLFFGPVSSVFDILTYGVMWFVFGAHSAQQQTLFQSGWFIEGLMTQTLVVHMIRTRKIPFIQSRPSMPLLLMTLFIMAVGIFIPMGPWAHYFKLQALPMHYFGILALILLGYMLLTQAMKALYTRLFGWQ